MNNIATIRKKLNLSSSELLAHLGWKGGRLRNYENGLRTPGLKECRSIVDALNHYGANCTLDDVFPPLKNKSEDAA